MVTKRLFTKSDLEICSVLAKILMVTKLSGKLRLNKVCSVLAKILMVTKLIMVLHVGMGSSVLAKILMVTKLPVSPF